MFRLKLGLIIGGLVLAYFGVQEFRLSMGTSTEAVQVDLAALEKGEALENNHVLIGEHYADYAGCVYEYEEGNGRVTHTYYPVISENHSFFAGLDKLAEKYGNVNDAPESECQPSILSKSWLKQNDLKMRGQFLRGLATKIKSKGW